MDQEKSRPDATSTVDRAPLRDHPIGFWFFFWGEFAERCCYYGMRAILLLYMIQILRFEDGQAARITSYFIAACYLLPLIGGYVADNFLGKYRTIVYFSVPYIVGQVILGISALHNETCLFISLGLLAMGSGVIKPNISTLMGLTYDQHRPGRAKLRSDAFAMFYGAINIGAALSSFCVPWIRTSLGGDSQAYAAAFLFPAALMVLAFIVFAAGKPFYAQETIHRTQSSPEERKQRLRVLGRLFGLFLVVTVFWSIFDQSASTWILFARDYLDLNVFGLQLSPDQIQAANPVLIVLFLPPITLLWHFLARIGLNLKPTSKMLIGFLLTGVLMGITAYAGFHGAKVVKSGAPAALLLAEQAAQEAVEAGKEAAVEDAPKAEPVAVVSASAARAAAAAAAAARAAYGVISAKDADRNAAINEAAAAAKRARSAADATTAAIDAVRKSMRERGDNGALADDRWQKVSTLCSSGANRAAAAGTTAGKAAEAAEKTGNLDAAETHAAVAGLAAADAALQAVQAAALAGEKPVPDVAAKVESAAAAARISLLWQLIPFVIITIAEICISVVGLELAFAAAPASMKSFVTACWLLTVFFGNILNAQITPMYNETVGGFCIMPGLYFLAFALLMIPVTAAFMFFARRFNDGGATER
jgi:POT family proton-dependent oligopeptide transporter